MRTSGKVLLILLLTATLSLVQLPTSRALTRVGALTLNSGENQLSAATIDSAGGFAYFGTGNIVDGLIIKIRLSDFTRVGALNVTSFGENHFRTAVIDPAHGFAYFGTVVGDLIRVRLSDFSRVDALSCGSVPSVAIDPAGGFLYCVSGTMLVKIRLSDFTQTTTAALNSGDKYTTSLSIDPLAGFGYVGTCCNSTTAEVIKFQLSNLARTSALTLNSGENDVNGAAIDPSGGFAYFVTSANTIVKIRLSDFTRNATLSPANIGLGSIIIDPPHNYAYVGAANDIVLRVRLSDMTAAGTLTLNSGEGLGAASVYDPTTAFAYLGQYTSPGVVVKIQTATIPASPSGLTATGGAGKVSLSWTAPSTNGGAPITGYKVYRGTSSGTETLYQSLGNVTAYQDNAATPGTTYFYKVTANNTAGDGGFSNEASATPSSGGVPALPALPTFLAIPVTIAAIAVAKRKKTAPKI
jgi:fibronectin type III domain protein